MSNVNTLALAPAFNLHREKVAAAEAAAVTNKKLGVNSTGFDQVALDLVLDSGSLTSCTLEVLYWSPGSEKFVKPFPAEEITMTEAGQATFNPVGRTFHVRVKALSGAAPVVSVHCAGVAGTSGQ